MDTFVRGDSFPFKTQITKKDGTPITLNEIETLFVTCRKMAIKESPILFQKKLEDYPAGNLYETIENFHNTPVRFENLCKSVNENRAGRKNLVMDEIKFF